MDEITYITSKRELANIINNEPSLCKNSNQTVQLFLLGLLTHTDTTPYLYFSMIQSFSFVVALAGTQKICPLNY